MTIISQTDKDFQRATDTVSIFFRTFHIASLLRAVGAAKQKGVPVMDIFRFILSNVFTGRSMYRQMLSKTFGDGFSKNACYRFLNNASVNWTKFTVALSALIAEKVRSLTEENRADAFIIDDTLYERTSAKRTELAARVFDHNEHRYKKGYRLLTLGWSDGTSFLPIAARLMSSRDDKKVLGMLPELDMRTTAGKIRAQARRKMTDVMVELLRDAIKAGHKAKYVLFDRWFSSPAQIKAIKALGKDKALREGNGAKLDVIAAIVCTAPEEFLLGRLFSCIALARQISYFATLYRTPACAARFTTMEGVSSWNTRLTRSLSAKSPRTNCHEPLDDFATSSMSPKRYSLRRGA